MRASEYIEVLKALIEEHGDRPCVDAYDHPFEEPEAVDDVFVLGDKA